MALEAEEGGVAPGFYAGAADADGDVALEHYTVLVGILGGMLELQVQVVLDEEVERSLGLGEFVAVYGIVAPLGIVGGAIFVTLVAVGCIGA